MADLSLSLTWGPQFLPMQLGPDQLLLLTEHEYFLLAGPQFVPLIDGVNSPRSIATILESEGNFYQQATLLRTIEDWLKRGLLHVSDTPLPRTYHRPDFSFAPVRFEDSSSGRKGWILSQYQDAESWTALLQSLALSSSIEVVIVDDYLDPRLMDINANYLQEEISWLIIKATGEKPWLGPCFNPKILGSPCWQCLASRLLHNQPVRNWLRVQRSNALMAFPILFEASRVESFFEAMREQTPQFWEQMASQLFEFSDEGNAMLPHPITHRPQCGACGNPDFMKQQQTAALVLDPSPKTHTEDGGFRSCSPQATCQAIQPSIDSITGVILHLQSYDTPQAGAIVTFRTAFFKSPYWSLHGPLTTQTFIQVSLGKGVSEAQSQASALAESIERYAVQYQGDEQKRRALPEELEERAILPQQLVPFSKTQFQQFLSEERQPGALKYEVEPYLENQPLHWILAWSLTYKEWGQVPFTFCHANTPLEDERFIRFHSNGCSAGNTVEEAILQGFLEVVERDATAIWWYNRLVRPAVELSELPQEGLRRIECSLGETWNYWVLDLTNDLQIPVMAAVAQHRENQTFCLGFGCHLDPRLASLRALTELCQLISVDNKFSGEFDFRKIPPDPFLFPARAEDGITSGKLSCQPDSPPQYPDLRDDIEYCVQQTKRVGLEVLVVNTSRPDLPLKTVKVIVPGLANIWPQFGNQRLYQIPVQCGWRITELSESELNPMGLFI